MNRPSSPERTLVLFGAPRTDGATATLLDLYLSEQGGAVTVVDCFARAVLPCDDCGGCHRMTRCAKRDMDDVYEALEQADRLVLAAPVYNRSFPAPMKAMLDRMQCYWARRFVHGMKPPIGKPRTAVLLTVCGSDRDDGEYLLRQVEPLFTVLHVTKTEVCHVKGTDGTVDWDAVAAQMEGQ